MKIIIEADIKEIADVIEVIQGRHEITNVINVINESELFASDDSTTINNE